MSIHAFTSESYSENDRIEAWQDVLGGFGLRSAPMSAKHGEHATALSRASLDGVALMRFAAGPQVFSPLPRRADLPIALMPAEDGAVLKTGGSPQTVPAGRIILLPRQSDWHVTFHRDMRAIVLSVTAESFGGRKISLPECRDAIIVASGGLADVLRSTLEAASESLENLSSDAWNAIRLSLAEMLLTLSRQKLSTAPDTVGIGTQAALLHRIYDAIERKLGDPDITPARIAQMEGISERYLQKLFEGTGDNFTHYLRERRLQRCWADLANAAEAHRSVSEIAFSCGFSDAAHFSRSFRDRFGLSPRAFRQQEIKRLSGLGVRAGQRGWPQDAIAQLRPSRHAPKIAPVELEAVEVPLPQGSQPAHHHHLPADAAHVHWGFFSRSLKPLIEIVSGDTITVETLTQHASDDPERMIKDDPGAESVFRWTREGKGVDRRGAGPMDASIYGRGAGEGFGVHICTGPIAVKGAEPGDVLEVRILDMAPRPSRNPDLEGRIFGSSVAAWWGYHYDEFLSEPKPREAVTIYEIFPGEEPYAQALYSYRWQPQRDPSGVLHQTYDYPGVPVAAETVRRRHNVLDGIRIPLRPHFGVIGVAPREPGLVDSVPPAYFGGNLDNWRLGKGAAVYLPVSVPEALLSIGDPHAAQGDGELSGTAIECSMTGTFHVVLHKKADLAGRPFADLTYPLIETETDWVLTGFSHPNYLAEFGAKGQSEVYAKSSLDLAMKDAFRKVRRFLMNTRGLSEDEAIALISAAVDFGVTQVVDGNWGVHAILSKRLFAN
ncbi:acetamidase/formamidase family protein [Bradyrhizobium canariense]|uniref:Transcriptional regulator, AraC family n=1 Tax=Bradyrhizobium canariense TaxID=255045 RepID=A0A1H1VSB2_9BRAD|nr:acetamidase/formamidase family protein [Bradyrhizobium canariense]SDS87653.1 transcriptional regulator, AraC family [Bradyrhizobium canariense]